jgi:hypothetical protein
MQQKRIKGNIVHSTHQMRCSFLKKLPLILYIELALFLKRIGELEILT